MNTKGLNEFTARTLTCLMTARADRAELDQQIEVMIRALADAHGLPAPYPPRDSKQPNFQ
jgi:hypothetical protein